MANTIPLINGTAYDYSQIVLAYLDTPLTDISSINYTVEQTKENNYGLGEVPISRGRGTKKYSGSLEIGMNDIEALRTAAPNGDLTAIPASDIVITYGNPQSVKVHILKNAEFMDDGVETSVDDTRIARTFNIIYSELKHL